MKPDYCVYPPQPAADLELAEQPDGARTVWVVGAASVGRYILLGETERKVLTLVDGERTPPQICEVFSEQCGGKLSLTTLTKFLTRLEQYGILAGERARGASAPESSLSRLHYIRFRLLNPEPLFARMLPKLRWVWTTGFFVFSASLLVITLLLALMNWAEVASNGEVTLREHFIAVFVAAWLVGITHEFAHGMTCKAFGGRATEIGALMVYYFLPALYCDVSGIYQIPTRGRRLWVIAAGVYWQLMVGAASLLAWFIFAPHTLPADLAFIVLLGSVLNVFFNANPLIKLDGYYFLSQALRLPNLMDRSRAHCRGLLKQALFGERNVETARYDRRERMIYSVFGLLSFVHGAALATLLVIFAGEWLIERFYLLGALMAMGIVLLFARRFIKQAFRAAATLLKTEDNMADANQTTAQATNQGSRVPFWRRRLVPLSIAGLVVAALLMPWNASVGNYGTLIAPPDKEAIIRAPESATLVSLRVQPGEQVAGGAVIGRMGNFDLEEQLVAAQTELARTNADYDRLAGELKSREEVATRAGIQLRQRQLEFSEIETERRQIAERRRSEWGAARVMSVSTSDRLDAATYPAALAALEAQVESRRAQVVEATAQRDRVRRLQAQGIMPRSELDAVETRAAVLAGALAAASQRLDAALVEHRRKHAGVTTEMDIAQSDQRAERMRIAKLSGELNGIRELIRTLESRRDLLTRKRAQFELVSPGGGTIFGEDLSRQVGQYFQKGAEICRVADTRQLLLRIKAPEREIGDIHVGHAVRLKARAMPDRVFRGVVSKIGGESEPDQYGQATYRVELTIDNSEGLLRPGMTAFARIDFDRQAVGRTLLHKVKQALRPELWML